MTTGTFPRISIVTPSFRGARLIEATMMSVLDQHYPDLEYLVMDGAGDDTRNILERYDSRLALWRSHKDDGQYAAITEGFNASTGDILGWINSDDMLLPRALFTVAEIFSAFPAVQWISTLRPGYWAANGTLVDIGRTPGFSRTALLDGLYLPGTRKRGHWIQQESTFFRRSLWEKVGSCFPPHDLAGDFALWCEFYKHADLYGVDYPLAGFRMIAGQRSDDMSRYQSQGSEALRDLRGHLGWRTPGWRQALYSPLARLPKLKHPLAARLGYDGHRIFRSDIRTDTTCWSLDAYRFLP